jgi:hypothetical protein
MINYSTNEQPALEAVLLLTTRSRSIRFSRRSKGELREKHRKTRLSLNCPITLPKRFLQGFLGATRVLTTELEQESPSTQEQFRKHRRHSVDTLLVKGSTPKVRSPL